MKSIHFLTIGAALAAVLQLSAGDTVVRKTNVSAAEAASAVRPQRQQPLVSLTNSRRLCQGSGECDRHVLTALGIPEQQHPAVGAAVRTGWQTLQEKFMVSASSKVIDGVHPVTFSGVLKMDVTSTAASLEQKLAAETSRQTAILIASLFENEMLRVFCGEHKVTYYDRRGYSIDGMGLREDQPCVLAHCTADGKMNHDIPPKGLGNTRFSGLEIRLAPDRVPTTAPSPFKFSGDYKW